MSFLKFWSSKKSGGGGGKKKAELEVAAGEGGPGEPDLEKRRLRHSLSISRSGRFKQRKRERSQILDRPEIFDSHEPATASSSSCSSLASQTHGEGERMRDTNTSGPAQAHHFRAAGASSSAQFCRSVDAPPGGLRMGHPVLT